jgi:hypothetical protein
LTPAAIAFEREIELCMFLAGAGGAPTVGKGGAGSARSALGVVETRVKNSKRVLASGICMTNDSGRLCEWKCPIISSSGDLGVETNLTIVEVVQMPRIFRS